MSSQCFGCIDSDAICLPGVSTWLAHSTGQSFYDAVGTISVGALLGLTALFLVQKNRQLLLGETYPMTGTVIQTSLFGAGSTGHQMALTLLAHAALLPQSCLSKF